MDIQCIWMDDWNAWLTFVTYDGDEQGYYEQWAEDEDDLFQKWRVNIKELVAKVRADTLEEFGIIEH